MTNTSFMRALLAFACCLDGTVAIAVPGDPDSSFGLSGAAALHTTLPIGRPDAVTPPGRLRPHGFALQPDGKIISFGAETGSNCQACQVVARMNSDGSPDLGFGNSGLVVTDMGPLNSFYNPTETVFQQDGRIIVLGYGDTGPAMARYMPDGILDNSFGSGGIVTSSILANWSRVLVLADGSLLAFGTQGKCGATAAQCDGAFTRFTSTGQLDTTFGTSGVKALLTTQPQSAADFYGVPSLTVQPDGSYLIHRSDQVGNCTRSTLSRFTSDYLLDQSFGYQGVVYVLPSACLSSVQVEPMADGRFVVIAKSASNGNASPSFNLLRYQENGSYDASFGTFGMNTISVPSLPPGSVLTPRALSFAPNGQLTLAGDYVPAESEWFGNSFLMRLNADGSLNTSLASEGIVLFGHRARVCSQSS